MTEGNYTIYTGLYDPTTGQRYPLNPGPGVNPISDDRYQIATLNVNAPNALVHTLSKLSSNPAAQVQTALAAGLSIKVLSGSDPGGPNYVADFVDPARNQVIYHVVGSTTVPKVQTSTCTPEIFNKYSANIKDPSSDIQSSSVRQACTGQGAHLGLDFKSTSSAIGSGGTLQSNVRLKSSVTPSVKNYAFTSANSSPIEQVGYGVWCANNNNINDASAKNVLQGAIGQGWQNKSYFCAVSHHYHPDNDTGAFLEVSLPAPVPISYVTFYSEGMYGFPTEYQILTKSQDGSSGVDQGVFTTQPDPTTFGAQITLVNVPVTATIRMVPTEFGPDTTGGNFYGFQMFGVTASLGAVQAKLAPQTISSLVSANHMECVPNHHTKQISAKVPGLKTTLHSYHCMGKGQDYFSTSTTKFMNGVPLVTTHLITPTRTIPDVLASSATFGSQARAHIKTAKALPAQSLTSHLKSSVMSYYNQALHLIRGSK